MIIRGGRPPLPRGLSRRVLGGWRDEGYRLSRPGKVFLGEEIRGEAEDAQRRKSREESARAATRKVQSARKRHGGGGDSEEGFYRW